MFFARSPRREEEEGEQLTGDNNKTGERTESGSVPRVYGTTYEKCCTSRSDYTTSPLLPPSAGGLLRSGGTARAAELLDDTARAVARRQPRTLSVRAGGDARHGPIHTSPTYTKYSARQK